MARQKLRRVILRVHLGKRSASKLTRYVTEALARHAISVENATAQVVDKERIRRIHEETAEGDTILLSRGEGAIGKP